MHSMFYLSKYALPHMKSGDTIVNCASVNPYIGRPDLLDYTSTKVGLHPQNQVGYADSLL
jgi:NAD(P)-dependent dehydrogenase (short-subunit alcohol dehydrogenase family)